MAVLLFIFLIAVVIVLLIGTKTEKKKKKGVDDANLPPGPRPLPIIGSMHLLFFNLPHHVFSDLANKFGSPLIHLRVGDLSFVVASSAEAAREIFKTHDLAVSERPQVTAMRTYNYDGQDIAFAPYGDHWRKMRKICTLELLSQKRVASMSPVREEEISRFITSIRAASPAAVDLSRMLHDLSMDMLARAAFGNQCRDKDDVLLIAKEMNDSFTGMDIADFFPSSAVLRWTNRVSSNHKHTRDKMDRVFNRMMGDRRGSKVKPPMMEEEEDLLEVLMKLHDDGELTADNVKAIILDMFVAGSDTTSTLLEWAMSELVRNPGVMERAQTEIRRGGKPPEGEAVVSYVKLVVKEALRLHPPGPFTMRLCRYPFRVLGYDVPEKARVLLNLWAIGRDPRYWDEPLEFRPERFLDTAGRDYKGNHYDYLPFGAGRRMCPGIAFGMANVELILANLLYYFDWKLPAGVGPHDLDMTEIVTGVSRRKVNLLLCPVPVY